MEPITFVVLVVGLAIAFGLTFLIFVVWKGLPFADGDLFKASRLTGGNRLFPTQVLITPTSVVHYRPRWIGAHEHSIHMAHVASVKIDTRMLFSDVFIETTGGANAIRCRGHRRGDALRMKHLIEQHQSDYYRQAPVEGVE
jgi:hypothetical protein